MLSEEDSILIKVLTVEKGYGTKKIMNLRDLGHFARAINATGSVTSNI